MPEPYPFPELPKDKDGVIVRFKDNLAPFTLGLVGEEPVLVTPPVEETNQVGFFFLGDKELFRFAFTISDDNRLIAITEDGKEISQLELQRLAFKIALGTERYEKVKDKIR